MSWKPGNYALLVDSSPERQEVTRRRPSTIGTSKEGFVEWLSFGESLPEHWSVQKGDGLGGTWETQEDGTLVGRMGEEGPSILWCDLPLEGDHMIEIQASTLPPYDNDISVLWDGAEGGWRTDDDGTTIGGIGGWWNGYAGVEARTGARCTIHTGPLEVGKIYNVAAGRVTVVNVAVEVEEKGGKEIPTGVKTVSQKQLDFLVVDGELVQLVTEKVTPVNEEFRSLGTDSSTGESGPKNRKEAHVGITTWNSAIKIHSMRISTLETIHTTKTKKKK